MNKEYRGPNSKNLNTSPNKVGLNNKSSHSDNRILYEAVVINFFSNPEFDLLENPINDPDKTYKESMETGMNRVSNPKIIRKMPRCSITALVVSDREAWGKSKPEIFYPLFPHMTMPVKPGEKIWVIYDTISRKSPRRGYWLGRISSHIAIDDPNYTHLDREFLYSKVSTQETSALDAQNETSSFEESDVYSFMAGAGDANKNTMPGEDPYNTIVSTSPSYIKQFNGEPVPRFSPRVGDFVIEGSNNTLISLGQDRPSLIGPDDESGIKGIGTIDVVAGRGQMPDTSPIGEVELEKRAENLEPYSESNKFPQFEDRESNEGEGNPDFVNDLSRVYVSMKTNGDANFGLEFTDDSARPVAEAPYVIAKSTEIRLVARDGGSIRMMKEGSAKAEICITSDGKIVIEGTNALRSSQPTMRGQDLVEALESFSAALDVALAPFPIGTTLGNMGGALFDGDGIETGIRAAAKKLASAAKDSLSKEVYIK